MLPVPPRPHVPSAAAGSTGKDDPVTFAEFKIKKLPFFIATFGEWIGLFFWLFFMERFSRSGAWPHATLANAILLIGFMIERLIVVWWADKNFGNKIKLPVPKDPKWIFLLWMIAITFSEIIVWLAFREIYIDSRSILREINPWLPAAVSLVVLFLGEQLQHSYELHAMKGASWSSQFFKFNTAIITALETAGGAGFLFAIRNPEWFAFAGTEQQETVAYIVGGASMLLGLGIEHVVEGQTLSPDSPA
jgi:hypothetical protein